MESATPAALQPIFQEIGQQLSNEYELTYRSLLPPHVPAKVQVNVAGHAPATASYTTPALVIEPQGTFDKSWIDKTITSPWLMIFVDRGWVPLNVDQPGTAAVAPPAGEVDVEGVLFASEGDPPGAVGGADTRETTLARVDLAKIQSQLPYPIAPDYLLLQQQSPAQPDGSPVPAPLPRLTEGPHLGYAIQWFTFAIIALAGFVILALRESRDESSAHDDAVG